MTLSTWLRAGGAAATWVSAPIREQVYRAFVIWRADGLVNGKRVAPGSWREWPNTSRMCGLE